MFKGTDPDLLQNLIDIFDNHCLYLRTKYAKYGCSSMLWLNLNPHKYYLYFIKVHDGEPNIDRKIAINYWLETLNITEEDYIGVELYNNAIRAILFKDIYNVMGEQYDVPQSTQNSDTTPT